MNQSVQIAALRQVLEDIEIAAETWRDSSAGPNTASGPPDYSKLSLTEETIEQVRAAIATAAPSPPLTPAPTGETPREYENTAAEALADIAAGLKRGLAQPRESEVAGEQVREQIVSIIDNNAIIVNEYGVDAYVNNTEQLADAVLRLLRQRTEAGQSWLPIESAPKDGSTILLSDGNGRWMDHWDGEGWALFSPRMLSLREWVGDKKTLPTCWQPLPTAPQAQGGR